MKIINLFGGPGSGKSTLAAGLFYEMKIAQHNCEIVTEYAKDMVWEERYNIFQDQIYILGKQNRKLLRLKDKVDYVITDSPIIMGIVYMVETPYDETLSQLIVEVFSTYHNLNIFVNRNHPYSEVGRNQNETEADIKAKQIKQLLDRYKIPYIEVNSDEITPKGLLNLVECNRAGVKMAQKSQEIFS